MFSQVVPANYTDTPFLCQQVFSLFKDHFLDIPAPLFYIVSEPPGAGLFLTGNSPNGIPLIKNRGDCHENNSCNC